MHHRPAGPPLSARHGRRADPRPRSHAPLRAASRRPPRPRHGAQHRRDRLRPRGPGGLVGLRRRRRCRWTPSSSSAGPLTPRRVLAGRDGPRRRRRPRRRPTPRSASPPSAPAAEVPRRRARVEVPREPPEVPAAAAGDPGPARPPPAPSVDRPRARPPARRAASAAAPAPGVEAEVLALVNTARAAPAAPRWSHDEGLAAVARAHSADMRDRGLLRPRRTPTASTRSTGRRRPGRPTRGRRTSPTASPTRPP